ncbi:MAG: glutamate-5-semialdehyde dehydrogenase [Anaerolineae bacterium]|nr:glutamate-5-semialdehyde dehydrogenase [Anaerolineae bacterium]
MANVDLNEMGKRAKAAAKILAQASTETKNWALHLIADGLSQQQAAILTANAIDIEAAKVKGLAPHLIERLTLFPARLNGIANDVRHVANTPDPVGEAFDHSVTPNGLRLHKRRIPLGVIGVIYESRPNVTIDTAVLAIKSGNGVILRGGSETIHSNRALVNVIQAGLSQAGLPLDSVQFIDDADRGLVTQLLRLDEYVDLIIPRGGNGLHQFCRKNATITVITGGIGVNHLFVDDSAEVASAIEIIFNAKTQRPSVCNTLSTLLVQRDIAATFLPLVAQRLDQKQVAYRCDAESHAILIADGRTVLPATPDDFGTEWLELTLNVKLVDGLDEAIGFVQTHSLQHSDGILSAKPDSIARFLNEINSSVVFANASTRFNDGAQFGLGAEVAISTQRIHARGPMGLRELTSYKWICEGDGQVRT